MLHLLLTRTDQVFEICYKAHSYLDIFFFMLLQFYSVSYSTHLASLDTC